MLVPNKPVPPKPKLRKASWQSVVALGRKWPIIPSNYWYGDFDDRTGKWEFNKTPAIRKDAGGNGLHDAVCGDEAALNALWERAPRWTGAGIRTGAAPEGSGFDLFDVDLQHPEARAWWEANKHRFPPTPTVHTPSGGLHLYLKHREGQSNTKGIPIRGIDVRGDNGLCWAWFLNGFPTENWTCEPAEWPDVPEIPLKGAEDKAGRSKRKAKPKTTAAQPSTNVIPFSGGASPSPIFQRPVTHNVADAVRSGLDETYDREPPPHTPENAAWVREMLDAIPVEGFGALVSQVNGDSPKAERDWWLDIGRALNWLGWGDAGRELYVAFSSRFGEHFDEDGLDTQWRSFRNEGRANPITIGTLIHLAKAAGWAPRPEPELPKPGAGEPWQSCAMRDSRNGFINNTWNARLAVEYEFPRKFEYNEFACAIMVDRDHEVKEVDAINMQVHLQGSGLKRIGMDAVWNGITSVAMQNRYHPVRDELLSVQWDGVARVNRFATDYLGCEATPYNTGIAGMFIVSMVARVFSPGCQCDHMIVLEGPQGTGKSSALRALASDQYFADSLPDIHTKDASQYLRGQWLVEISEMHTFNKADNDRLKAYLTRREEKFRPPYQRTEVIEKRQCVFAGTMNPIGGYLRDPTGGRRFWGLAVGTARRINTQAIARDRLQLFAEAYQLYQNGHAWWPSGDFERDHIVPEQDARAQEDLWQDAIETWLAAPVCCGQRIPACLPGPQMKCGVQRTRATVSEVAIDALQIGYGQLAGQIAKVSRHDQNRIMDSLTRLGWERGPRANAARWWVPTAKWWERHPITSGT